MDAVLAMLVRVLSAVAIGARVLPRSLCARYEPGQKLKILLAGYNGARNTGSDVRVAALVDQLLEAYGPENIEISVMSLDVASTAVYFEGKARQIPFNTLFFLPLFKACLEHHVAVLCEGSTFKSTFADALTLYSCEAAGVMAALGKPCVAYGGEVGAMSPVAQQAVRDLCADVLFMARSEPSCRAARELGLEARLGTDTAWTFDSARGHDEAERILREGSWDGQRPLLGIAPVNPYWWPVKPSVRRWIGSALSGERDYQYQKWYYFSWSSERAGRYRAYLDELAAAAMTFAAEQGFQPVIIGMEKLDADACGQMAARIGRNVPVLLAGDWDGYVIGEVLRSLSLLVTSRFHAQVLACGAGVPTVAVSMDERLDNLAHELKMPGDVLVHVGDEDLGCRVLVAMDYAHANRSEITERARAGRTRALERLQDMTAWFAEAVGGPRDVRAERLGRFHGR